MRNSFARVPCSLIIILALLASPNQHIFAQVESEGATPSVLSPDGNFQLYGTSELPTYHSCAVVGSSGSLLGGHSGAWIDSHDAVFRINIAPTHSYERFTGNKTTVRICNGRKDVGKDCTFPNETVDLLVSKYTKDMETPEKNPQRPTAINTARLKQVLASANIYLNDTKRTHWQPKFMTSGLLATAAAIVMCGSIDVIGFDNPARVKARMARGNMASAPPFHYYDAVIPKGGFAKTPHDFVKEHTLICCGGLLKVLDARSKNVRCWESSAKHGPIREELCCDISVRFGETDS